MVNLKVLGSHQWLKYEGKINNAEPSYGYGVK